VVGFRHVQTVARRERRPATTATSNVALVHWALSRPRASPGAVGAGEALEEPAGGEEPEDEPGKVARVRAVACRPHGREDGEAEQDLVEAAVLVCEVRARGQRSGCELRTAREEVALGPVVLAVDDVADASDRDAER
jgi:hypothetical protein